MGGCGSKKKIIKEEETKIVEYERKFLFHQLSPIKIDLYIRKYSRDGSLSPGQLKRSAEMIGIQTDSEESIAGVYELLTNGYAN